MANGIEELVENHQNDERMFLIKGEEVTLHRATGILREPISGVPTGIQQGLGETFYEGEKVAVRDLSPFYVQALENENHPSHDHIAAMIEFDTGDPRQALDKRLGVPFEGYDEMDSDDIVNAMRVLPSATIAAIKQYESEHEARPEIVNYNVGFGESPVARQTGAVSSEVTDPDETKAAAQIRTRQTPAPEDEVVQPGEGVTGTGEGVVKDTQDDAGKKKVVRRSRSSRKSQGSGSGDEAKSE